jgi:hypothetical protein
MAINRGKDVAMMEQLVLSDRAPRRGELADLALELA